MFEKFDELHVGLLRRDVTVYKAKAERESRSLGEIGLDEFGPLGGDGLGDFRIAVAGEVGEVHLWLLALRRVSNGEKVDGASATRRRGHFGLF